MIVEAEITPFFVFYTLFYFFFGQFVWGAG